MTETHAKILFRYHSIVLNEEVVETMWSEIIDLEKGIYKLDNIFYGPLIATDDIFYAKYDEGEKAVVYKETISLFVLILLVVRLTLLYANSLTKDSFLVDFM